MFTGSPRPLHNMASLIVLHRLGAFYNNDHLALTPEYFFLNNNFGVSLYYTEDYSIIHLNNILIQKHNNYNT